MGLRMPTGAVLAGYLVAVLLTAGCALPERRDGENVSGPVEAWVGSACAAVGTVAETADRRSELDWSRVSDPATAAELVSHLKAVSTQIGSARASIEALGSPPVEDGEAVLADLRGAFDERQQAVDNAADFIEGAASRIDPLAQPQIARAAQAAYTAAPKLAREIERKRQLRDPFAANSACANL
ncbi:hypothetical protein GGQ54_000049 [Naumannella cuiyingiana]|uniref:Uncharacterized protein n=1 Tax=Naumannella cuiyingiana TaxID=1347891 RepID=A0A7Z0D626_9ACTN|nr:hypothetical protein [Naumannella cuiyingiana]NYI69489.1 hypothetical protein [Naumannella cuiyingiana]